MAVSGLGDIPCCARPLSGCCLEGGGMGSLAMACSSCRSSISDSSVYPLCASINSTISTSPADIKMVATPSIGTRLPSCNHSPCAILKCPSSGRPGHSSGRP